MISFPLYWLLFIYFIFLAIYIALILVNIYHILEANIFSTATFLFTFFVIVLSLFIVYFSWELVSEINWQQELILFNSQWLQ
ncbi:MAG: hypothetical protein ABEJ02_04345 [Candidatus Paceibacteria bacterium]